MRAAEAGRRGRGGEPRSPGRGGRAGAGARPAGRSGEGGRAARAALLVLGVGLSPAPAGAGLFLTWNDCASGPTAAARAASACDSDAGERSLYCAFRLPAPLDSVVAVEVVLDVQVAAAELPAWWQFAPGGCRQGLLAAVADFPGSACSSMWLDADPPPGGGLAGYFVGEPRNGANQARIKVTFAVLSAAYRRLEAGVVYNAARLVLRDGRTSSCAGCAADACLVLNSILIGRLPGAPGGNLILDAAAAGANRATWQGGGADCDAVPAVRRTWGQLKSLYR